MNKLSLLIITTLFIISCSSKDIYDDSYSSKNRNLSNNNLTKKYENEHELEGSASWYGPGFDGKLTASGEIFDMSKISAAHKTLPFGTVIKVTNLENNKSVKLKVNDRGPFSGDRIIDLSKEAFSKISHTDHGIINVKIEIVDDSNTFRYKKPE